MLRSFLLLFTFVAYDRWSVEHIKKTHSNVMYTQELDGTYRRMTAREHHLIASEKALETPPDVPIHWPARAVVPRPLLPPTLVKGAPPAFPSAFPRVFETPIPGGETWRPPPLRQVTVQDIPRLAAFLRDVVRDPKAAQRLEGGQYDAAALARMVPPLSPADAPVDIDECTAGTRVLLSRHDVGFFLAAESPRPEDGWWGTVQWVLRGKKLGPVARSLRKRLSVAVPTVWDGRKFQVFLYFDREAGMRALAQEVRGCGAVVRCMNQAARDDAKSAGVEGVEDETGPVLRPGADWIVARRGTKEEATLMERLPRLAADASVSSNPWLGEYFGRSLLAY